MDTTTRPTRTTRTRRTSIGRTDFPGGHVVAFEDGSYSIFFDSVQRIKTVQAFAAEPSSRIDTSVA